MPTNSSVPPTQRPASRIDAVDWPSILPFLKIFGAVSSGLRPKRVGLTFILLLTVVAAGRVWDGFAPATSSSEGLFAGPIREKQLVDAQESVRAVVIPVLLPEQRANAQTASLDELEVFLADAIRANTTNPIEPARYSTLMRMIDAARPRASFEALNEAVRSSFYALIASVGRADFPAAIGAAHSLFVGVPVASWASAPIFTVFFVVVCILAFGRGSGVLCRLSAGDMSMRNWSLPEASDFIRPRISTLIFAPIFAVVLGFVLWIPAWALGLSGNLPILNVVGGVFFGVALVSAALSAIVVVVLLVGFPLIAPAVACDGCDAVESIQRAGAYLFARPLHLLWYGFISLIVIVLGTLVADFAATIMWSFASASYESASGETALSGVGNLRFLQPYQSAPPALLGLTQSITVSLIDMWRTILCLLIGACSLSIAFACATRTYLLIRLNCDGQDVCDLWEDSLRSKD
ncbi:MAG: hypothetical protein O2875_07390 [Planctomycetota bacterium]|nr:hypothetical protein [Planctomycetota bacterium]